MNRKQRAVDRDEKERFYQRWYRKLKLTPLIPGRVTIVIPLYNQVQYVREAIDSAKRQTYEDIEIVVVDDGSTQDISGVIRDYACDRDWVFFIHQENKGLAAARNAGIKFASGEWILPLDADDRIHHTFVEKAVNANTDIVSSWIKYFGTYDTLFKPDPTYTHREFLIRNRINCCSLFRKSMWEKVGGYDELMREGYEDWDFWIRSTALGYKVVVLQETLFYYRKHGKSMVDHAMKNRARIMAYMKTKYKLEAA